MLFHVKVSVTARCAGAVPKATTVYRNVVSAGSVYCFEEKDIVRCRTRFVYLAATDVAEPAS